MKCPGCAAKRRRILGGRVAPLNSVPRHSSPCRAAGGDGTVVATTTRTQGEALVRATLMYGDVRVTDVPDPVPREPSDAVVRVLRSCVCGSDLWPYGAMPVSEQGRRMGHEFLGVVEDVGAGVSGLRRGDVVVAPIGDGVVGLSAVLAARRLGAERIILMGRHADRVELTGEQLGKLGNLPPAAGDHHNEQQMRMIDR